MYIDFSFFKYFCIFIKPVLHHSMTSSKLGVILRQGFSCWWYPLLSQSNIFHCTLHIQIFESNNPLSSHLRNLTLLPTLSCKFLGRHLWTVKYIIFDWLIDSEFSFSMSAVNFLIMYLTSNLSVLLSSLHTNHLEQRCSHIPAWTAFFMRLRYLCAIRWQKLKPDHWICFISAIADKSCLHSRMPQSYVSPSGIS